MGRLVSRPIVLVCKMRIVMSRAASLVTQLGKNLPAMRKTRVRSLGQEDPLGKEMATHSSILAWETPWEEEL